MIILKEQILWEYQIDGKHYAGLPIEESAHQDFLKKHGIKTVGEDSIGFSEDEQKWYGWSHRAIYGFGIGYEVKEGDVVAGDLEVGFKCKTLDDCKKVAKAFAEGVS